MEATLEIISFDKIKDEFIGEVGTVKRTLYEQELQLEMLGDLKEVGILRQAQDNNVGK